MLAHFGSVFAAVALGSAVKNSKRIASGYVHLSAQLEVLRGYFLGRPWADLEEKYWVAVKAATAVLPEEDQALMRHYVLQAGLEPADFGL